MPFPHAKILLSAVGKRKGRTMSTRVKQNRWAMLEHTLKKAFAVLVKAIIEGGHLQKAVGVSQWEPGLCVFPFILKCRVSCAMSVGGPLPAAWSLINTASTSSSETGATSHTPRCKIMSLQWAGIIYMGGERNFLSLRPRWIFKWNEERGRRCNWLDLSQRKGQEHTLPLPYTCI